jgi:fructoselysine-6-P-deglycase FrlB-like protein
MLDDLKYIHEKDRVDALGMAEHQYEQLLVLPILTNVTFLKPISNVVYCAMGGPALAGLLVKACAEPALPFEVVQNYDIPEYVSSATLFIAASYSGDTEETLSALKQAAAEGAQIVIITSGGSLQQIAEEKNYPLIQLPRMRYPRHGIQSPLEEEK